MQIVKGLIHIVLWNTCQYMIEPTEMDIHALQRAAAQPVERSKIRCARKLFNEISDAGVKYHDVDSYESLMRVMTTL